MTDYYAILEVPSTASISEVKQSYYRLALRYHPDRAGPEGVERFKEIQAAYEVLSNPEKRAIYDRYGAAAVDNMFSDALMKQVNVFFGITLFSITSFLIITLIIIYLAFLSAYVDGRLARRDENTLHDKSRSYWNYVKVFSPLFAADVILVAVEVFLLVFFAIYCRVAFALKTMSMLSLVIVNIIVPVTLDYNEEAKLASIRDATIMPNFRSWTVWLTPLYISAALYAVADLIATFPISRKHGTLKECGFEGIWLYRLISFIISILRGACTIVLSILTARRADDAISANYFLVLGLPCFIYGTLLCIEQFLLNYTLNKAAHEGVKPNLTCLKLIPIMLMVALVLASVAMVCKHLNDVSSGRPDPFHLSKALSPIFIILAVLILVSLIITCNSVFMLCCRQGFPSYGEEPSETERAAGAGEESAERANGSAERNGRTGPNGAVENGQPCTSGASEGIGNRDVQQKKENAQPSALLSVD